jgi:hypothetical protein
MKHTSKIVAISAVSLALAGGVSVGLASADPSTSPTPTASPTASAAPNSPADKKAAKKADKQGKQEQRGGGLIKRALHGEVTTAGKKHLVVLFQRGAVESVSGSSITVKSTDGFSQSYALAATTKVRSHQAPAKLSDIEAADRVRVVATKTGDTVTAKVVSERAK